MADYLLRFANDLDPNGNTGIEWPKYTAEDTQLLQFQDGFIPLVLTQDDYRVPQMKKLNEVLLQYPV